jgi:hypothetical protein
MSLDLKTLGVTVTPHHYAQCDQIDDLKNILPSLWKKVAQTVAKPKKMLKCQHQSSVLKVRIYR